MKDKLIKAIREVPIADKTYPEYIEALADKLMGEIGKIFESIETHSHISFINGNEDTPMLLVDYEFYKELKKKYEVAENGT